MKSSLRAGALAFAMLAVFATSAFADTSVINIGAAFGSLRPYVDSIVGGLIFLGITWGAYILKTKWNIDIDASMRDALQSWLLRQAGSLTAAGAVRVQGLQITVGNAAVSAAANLAIREIPDAIAHFGLTPDKLAEMIVDKLPHVPAVAAVAASTAVPAK